MVAPVQGPFRVTEDFKTLYRRRERYKQAPPFTLPLPYTIIAGSGTPYGGLDWGPSIATRPEQFRNSVLTSSQYAQMATQIKERFMGNLSDRSSMGENLVEFNKSLGTMANKIEQLLRFTKAVKRGRFGDAANILQTGQPKRLHPVKEQANNWLEYHLGIAPVVGDIYSAMHLLSEPIKSTRVTAKGSVGGWLVAKQVGSGPFTQNFEINCTGATGRCQADVAVTNPNLFLLNALGVINPIQVAWQLVPLSFVVDWFVNVEQYLGSFTDLLGVTVQNASATYRYTGVYTESWNNYPWGGTISMSGFDRYLGLPVPRLAVRPYKALGWQRGLTAISLLVPALKSLDKTNLKVTQWRDPFGKTDRRSTHRARTGFSGDFSF